VENVGYLPSLKGTTYFAGKEQSKAAKIQFLKGQNTSYPFHSQMTILSSLQKSSLKPAASIPMWISMATFAWTFFR